MISFPQSQSGSETRACVENRDRHVQLGLHIILTSYGIAMLRAPDKSEILDLIDMTLLYFRKFAPMGDALLNEEPLYLAGQILGNTIQSLDEASEDVWANYHAVYADVTREWASRDELLATLGRAVSATQDRVSSEFIVEIVPA